MLEEDFPALSVPPLNLVLEEGVSPGYAPEGDPCPTNR